MCEEEIWLPIPDFEDFYLASSFGRIKSIFRYKTVLTPSVVNKYYSVTLCGTIKKNVRVHIQIAKTFIPNPDNLPQVNHKDGNKLNNRKDNLEWSTASGNIQHAIRNNLFNPAKGDNHVCSKMTSDDVRHIRKFFKENPKTSQISFSLKYNVSKSCIHNILKNKTWKHITE